MFHPREKARLRVGGKVSRVSAAESNRRFLVGFRGVSPNKIGKLIQNKQKGTRSRREENEEGEFGNALLTWFAEVGLQQRMSKLRGEP